MYRLLCFPKKCIFISKRILWGNQTTSQMIPLHIFLLTLVFTSDLIVDTCIVIRRDKCWRNMFAHKFIYFASLVPRVWFDLKHE